MICKSNVCYITLPCNLCNIEPEVYMIDTIHFIKCPKCRKYHEADTLPNVIEIWNNDN